MPKRKRIYTEEEIAKSYLSNNGYAWIPVSERLPDKEGRYLVTHCGHGDFPAVDFDIVWDFSPGPVWMWFGETITAWMPLPKPYKGR